MEKHKILRSELADIERSCVYLDSILKNAYEIEEHVGDPREIVKLIDNIVWFVETVRDINHKLRVANWELTETIQTYEGKLKGFMEEQ